MKIDFEKIVQENIVGFKGGEGLLHAQNYIDGSNRIMKMVLTPGASVGQHLHDNNCEIIFVLQGELTIFCDDVCEKVSAGQAHYCPKGHSHRYENQTSTDASYYAVVV